LTGSSNVLQAGDDRIENLWTKNELQGQTTALGLMEGIAEIEQQWRVATGSEQA
jgi:hypothetical protein